MATGTRRLKKRWSEKADGSRIEIQRGHPFGRLAPRKVYPISLGQVRPVIRIAHQVAGPVQIEERIIFDYELVLFLKGKGTMCWESKEIPFGPHELFCVSPFVPHAISADGACEHVAVHFDWAPGIPVSATLSDRMPYEVRLPSGLKLPERTELVAGDRNEDELQQLAVAWQSGEPLGALVAISCLLRVLVSLLRQGRGEAMTDDAGRSRVRMEKALALLDDPSAPSKTPATLARAAGLSVSHFNRLFLEWTGFTPMEYQRRQRITKARVLLGDAHLSIKEIAAQCGFDDPYHFSRVFRQLDGLSPSQFREAKLAGRPR
jgi:AraC-like DNA-binding protein